MSSNFDFLECLDDLLDVAESSELFIEIDMDLDLSIADGGLAFPLPMRAGHGPSALATGSLSGMLFRPAPSSAGFGKAHRLIDFDLITRISI